MMPSPTPPSPASADRRTAASTPVTDISQLLPVDAATKASVRILVIDDERTLRESCASALQVEGYRVQTCGRGDEALETLKRHTFDIVLVDLYMGHVPGMQLLAAALAANPEAIVIVITGKPSVESALEALRAGAWDYLPKPFTGTQLQVLIGRAAHTVQVARETRAQQERTGVDAGGLSVLGNAPVFRDAITLARRVATTDASVFITGESGSGKEMIAQFIHQHSRRSSRPLVAVNCAALPETLLESEMFGHVKGAFTGAVRDKPGLLETANGGTLLLDELVDMSKPIQAKLLRVIQDGVVRRVGSETTDAVVNVRFIACTNHNPEEAVAAGTLREDLYYRLRVVPIRVPSLRERPTDILLLAEHFLAYYWTRHRGPGAPPPRFTEAAIRSLRARAWKGNVRELENVVEHMVVLLEPGSEIRPEDIPALDKTSSASSAPSIMTSEVTTEEPYYSARDRLVASFELQYLTQLVTEARGNMSRAARAARLDRTTLYRLIERHGLHRKAIRETNDPPAL